VFEKIDVGLLAKALAIGGSRPQVAVAADDDQMIAEQGPPLTAWRPRFSRPA